MVKTGFNRSLLVNWWSIGGQLGILNHWRICLCSADKLVLKAFPTCIMYMRLDYIFISEQDKIVLLIHVTNYLRSLFLFDHKSKDIIAG